MPAAKRKEKNAQSLTELSDAGLIAAHRNGDEAAFRELVERYRGELFHFLLRFVRSRAAADDLFQETFLQVFISADSFDTDRRFKPWLFTIGTNKARDYLRRHRRTRMAPLSAPLNASEGNGQSFVDLLEADLPQPAFVAQQGEEAGRVRAAVDELPEHLKEVLLLAYFQKLAYKEIAAQLEIPLGTVKSRLHAAVGTFAQLWKSREEGDVDDT